MAENYKHLYEQTKKMLTMYQDELIPGFRKQIEELESTVANQRKRADTAETFICTMCSECEWENNDGILIMQKSCCSWFPECQKFKLRVTDNNVGCKWIPVTERLPEPWKWVLCYCRAGIIETLRYDDLMDEWDTPHPSRCYMKGFVTHWMPLPEPPKEVE